MPYKQIIRVQIATRAYFAMRATDIKNAETPIAPVTACRLLERELLHPRDLHSVNILARAMARSRVAGSNAIPTREILKAFEIGEWVLIHAAVGLPSSRKDAAAESVADQLKTAKVVKTWIEFE